MMALHAINLISAPAAGPFSPQISPEGIARVPLTQLGPAPAAEPPRGGGTIFCSTKTQHQTPAGGAEQTFWVAMKSTVLVQQPKVVLDERQVRCAYDSMPSGQWIPKIFRPKG